MAPDVSVYMRRTESMETNMIEPVVQDVLSSRPLRYEPSVFSSVEPVTRNAGSDSAKNWGTVYFVAVNNPGNKAAE